MNTTQNGHI